MVELPEHAVAHAIDFDPQKQVDPLHRQVNVELHVFLLGRCGQPGAPIRLIPAHHGAVVTIRLRLRLELADTGTRRLDLRCRLGVAVIVEHAALGNLVARRVERCHQVGLGLTDVLAQRCLGLPVGGTERARALEHQVLEKVGRSGLAWRLVEPAHVGEDLARPR